MDDHDTAAGLRQRLKQSEDLRIFAESTLETVRQALLVLDGDLRVVYANRWFCETFRVEREGTEGERVYDLGNGQWDIPKLRSLLEEVIPTGESFEDFEVEHCFEHIGERIMRLNGRCIRQGEERAVLVLLAVEDVTERETAQRALNESERQYRTLVESINSIIIRADVDGRITFINRFAEQVFGTDRYEWLGEPLFGNVIPCPDDDCAGLLRRILEDPEPFYINESRIRRPDGSPLFFSWSAKGVRDGNGRVVELLIDGNDMSPLADFRQRLDDALDLLDASPDPTALLDDQNRPLFVNSAFEQVLEAGSPLPTLGQLAADNPVAAALLEFLRRTREARMPLSVDSGKEDRRLHWHAIPVQDGRNREGRVMLFARDITERETARREAERNAETLERRNAELDIFNHSVSHDLRGPLRALTGFTAMLLEDYGERLDDTAQHYLRRIEEGARNMGGMLDGLLTLSQTTRTVPVREPVDLSAMANSIIDELTNEFPDREVQVAVEPDLSADADPRLLRTVLGNLLGNAWKYTSRTPGASIAFGRCSTPRGDAFYVRDNGAGFEAQHAAELFKPFGRLHSQQEFAGSGIGLATVERAVLSHGGDIWAEGKPSRGATFYFTLG